MPRAPLLLLALTACWTEETDPADVCIVPPRHAVPSDGNGEVEEFLADHPVDVVLTWQIGNDEHRDVRCSLARDGNEFTVDGSFERKAKLFEENEKPNVAWVRCITDPLPAGDYTFTHAGETLTLTVPSSVPAPCIIRR